MSRKDLDLSQMKVLKMPERSNARLEVRVSEKGEMALSSRLFQKIVKNPNTGRVHFCYQEDYRTIALQPGAEDDLKFSKTGKLKHPEYANKLEALGYGLPARYRVEWSEGHQAWVGELQEVCPAPVENLPETPRRTRQSRKNS